MESGAEHYEKRSEAAELVRKAVENTHNRYGINADIEETPETVLIKLKDAGGKVVKEMGFMKMVHLPINDKPVAIEKVIEARLRFPDLDVADAISKTE